MNMAVNGADFEEFLGYIAVIANLSGIFHVPRRCNLPIIMKGDLYFAIKITT